MSCAGVDARDLVEPYTDAARDSCDSEVESACAVTGSDDVLYVKVLLVDNVRLRKSLHGLPHRSPPQRQDGCEVRQTARPEAPMTCATHVALALLLPPV